jgi:hypothetical protein
LNDGARAHCFALTGLALLAAHPWALRPGSSGLPIKANRSIRRTSARIMRFLRLLRHRHHVTLEIGDDPDRAGDDEKDDQHAKGESQNIIRAVGPAAQMQKEDEMDADLRYGEHD